MPQRRAAAPWLRVAALVALFGLTAGVGGSATYAMRHALPHWGADDATLQTALRTTKEQVARLGAELKELKSADGARTDDSARAIKRSVENMKAELDQLRDAGTTAATQATARLDKLERDAKNDRPAVDAGKDRTADLATRLDRLEKQAAVTVAKTTIPAAEPAKVVASAKPATPPAPAPSAAPVLPPARPGAAVLAKADTTTVPAAAPAALRGWVLRDVYNGLAVVQARGGELREIGPGAYLPGAGEVRSIERRGRSWVVLTSRGVIDAATF